MNRDRMVLLLDILARVERGEAALMLDMDGEGKPIDAPIEVRRLGFNMATWFCGTAACAAGHLCLDARAREQGLRLELNEAMLVPYYRDKFSYQALAYFLEISLSEAGRLFNPFEYLGRVSYKSPGDRDTAYQAITPAGVAERVREIMARERQETERIANALEE
jgi:hypothetical protein